MSRDGNECNRSWDTSQITDYKPPTGRSIRKPPPHRSVSRTEPPPSVTFQPSSTTFAEEIRNLINRHGGTSGGSQSRSRYPNYPMLPPPTAYRNSNRNTPLRALPIHAPSRSGSEAHQSTENDKELCRFFAKVSQSNSSIAIQKFNNNQVQTSTISRHNNQRQVQVQEQRSQVESHSKSYYNNQSIQAVNSRIALDGHGIMDSVSRKPSMNFYPQQSQLQQSQAPHYLTYPISQVPYSIPNNQICHNPNQSYSQQQNQRHIATVQSRMSLQNIGSRDAMPQESDSNGCQQNEFNLYQSNDPLNQETDESIYCQKIDQAYCSPNEDLFQHQQNESVYDNHCQQNNVMYPSPHDSMYYQPSDVMYAQNRTINPHLQQQVNIQQAHLTLKTTQVATVGGNFHNPSVAVYPSMEALCNIWGQPQGIPCQIPHPTSPPSNFSHSQHQLNLMQPLQYIGQQACQLPNYAGGVNIGPYLPPNSQNQPNGLQYSSQATQEYNSNQRVSHSDLNLTRNTPSHTTVDLGTKSDSHIQLNQSGSPQQSRKLTPWSRKNYKNEETWKNLKGDEVDPKNVPKPNENKMDSNHQESHHQSWTTGPLQQSDSNSSLSANETYTVEESATSKRSESSKPSPAKAKVRGRPESFVPTVEDVLKDLEKDLHKKTMEEGMAYLQGTKWMENVLGLKVVILKVRAESEKVIDELADVLFQVNRHLKSPKSKLCRQAVSCFKELFLHLGPLLDSQLDGVADKLLKKTMDTNKFIRDECESALEAMVRSCTPAKVVFCLESVGRKHKNVIVRTMSCRMTRVFIDYLGPSTSLADHGDKLLPMLFGFLEEPTNDIREEAKKAIKMLIPLDRFDEVVDRYVRSDIAARVKDRVERIRDEVLNRTPRRRRKKNEVLF